MRSLSHIVAGMNPEHGFGSSVGGLGLAQSSCNWHAIVMQLSLHDIVLTGAMDTYTLWVRCVYISQLVARKAYTVLFLGRD